MTRPIFGKHFGPTAPDMFNLWDQDTLREALMKVPPAAPQEYLGASPSLRARLAELREIMSDGEERLTADVAAEIGLSPAYTAVLLKTIGAERSRLWGRRGPVSWRMGSQCP